MLRRRQLPIEFSELQSALRSTDPAAVLVPPSVLRRIIHEHRDLARLGMPVTHRSCYWIDRKSLLEIADKWELGLEAHEALADTVILLVRPDFEELASRSRDELLVSCWRNLFHIRVHLALEEKFSGESVDAIDRRIERLGRTEFYEMRPALRAKDRVLPPRDSKTAYIELAATYLEYRCFESKRLHEVFPSLLRTAHLDALLAEDIDAGALFAQTRLEGAPDPQYLEQTARPAHDTASEASARIALGPPRPRRVRWLLKRAERAAALGNNVRAAVLLSRAARIAERQDTSAIAGNARRQLEQLADRLRPAFALDDAAVKTLKEVLPLLAAPAAAGMWPVERRLLYDLQNACIDHERNVYKVDLIRWIFSLGRTPLKRPLPNQREVLITRHLRSAARRLGSVRIAANERHRLSELLHHALHHSQEHLRTLFRPVLDESLGRVGLRAENLPERVGRNKLIEELADHIIDRGHLNMSNVRDALSRNRLKLKDLHGVNEFWQGDKLLLLNEEFTRTLDGIYHKGEFYLRWLQRLSSLAFATPVGRFFTRYVALPFGGAFMVLKFIEELAHLVMSKEEYKHVHIGDEFQILVLGAFFLGLFYIADFRNQVVKLLKGIYRKVRWVTVELPRDFGRMHTVRAFVRSEPFQFFYRNAFKPLTAALLAWTVLVSMGEPMLLATLSGAVVFLVGTLLVNTRWGRRLDERLSSRLARTWHQIHRNIIPGIIRGTMDFFHRVLDTINAGLYAVDEWLRFRHGESGLALGFKAVFGCFWAAFTYVVRAGVNLLVEPQVNPIKHFPVVTVSHKLILPLIPVFAEQLYNAFGADPIIVSIFSTFGGPVGQVAAQEHLGAMSMTTAILLVTSVIWLIPGIFGFLVWELKENWRLYEANRPGVLKPVMIGHHGETMVGLLRPGFHSGTIPKLFTRIRRAKQEAEQSGEWQNYHNRKEQMHHVQEAVEHFFERELLALVYKSRMLWPMQVTLARLEFGDYRVAIELGCSIDPDNHFRMAFEEQNGWLVADIMRHGWLHRLTSEQLQTFRTALAGVCKMAGVELVRPQIRAVLGTREFGFDVVNRGLLVWPRGRSEVSALYDLWNGAELKPQLKPDAEFYPFPMLPLNAVNFAMVPITWEQWLATWMEDPEGESCPHVHVEAVHVLPLQPNTAVSDGLSELSGGWKRDLG